MSRGEAQFAVVGHVRAANAEVALGAVRALDHELVARRDVAQESEVRVAMRGDHRIARVARQRRAVQMAGAERQRAAGRAGEHQHVRAVPRA